MHVLWMPYTYTFLFGKFLTGNSAREMVGHGDISEPVAQLLPYFVCVCDTQFPELPTMPQYLCHVDL